MARSNYWDMRCERWGAWRVGGAGMKIATWARLRVQSSSLASWTAEDESLPRLHIEERETHDFIVHLASDARTADLARFALAAYPRTSRLAQKLGVDRRSLGERFKLLHRTLARLLDQRRRGEPLDASRRRARGRAVTVRAQMSARGAKRPIASVVGD